MGDVDLLVRAEDRARATRALLGLDYVAAFDTRASPRVRADATARRRHGPGEHPDNPLKIELHEAIAEYLPVRTWTSPAACFPQ